MNATGEEAGARPCWFVGAGKGSQLQRFVEEGVWQCEDGDKYDDQVKSIQVGDRIAIKSTYTQKRNLPFDNRGHFVAVMAIKATGIVLENIGDGRTLKVDWKPFDSPREWYFYTHTAKVWSVFPGGWYKNALIGFAFEDKPQDYDQFRNAPYWRERFGTDRPRFKWTNFYESLADKLLEYKERRDELIAEVHKIASKTGFASYLQDRFVDGSSGPLKDICPFTVMGMFNRKIDDDKRKAIAGELASFVGVAEPVPDSFKGIPRLFPMASWFFHYEKDRHPDDIDVLWEVFSRAIAFADLGDDDARLAFISAYDKAIHCRQVKWNLSTGFYWIRPWSFPTLDKHSREFIEKKLTIHIAKNFRKKRVPDASDYLEVLNELEAQFLKTAYQVHSFPELSLAAWRDGKNNSLDVTPQDEENVSPISNTDEPPEIETPPRIEPYSVDHIMSDGCFIDREKLEQFLERLRTKKNLILQGPPGTGKTWLARRLAFALIGERDDRKVRAVQFHPNLSYEDFVRGLRPAGDGKLTLVDGPFLKMMTAAKKDSESAYVIVIEEINRGNPAQIFGELLTLLEVDKRTPNEALQLSYSRDDNDDERVFIPHNVYVIGTMNIADRSLALVDLALRRRFAFIDLEPSLGKRWHDWVHENCGIDSEILDDIKYRLTALNDKISEDTTLGPQFRVGHSYVTPSRDVPIDDAREWFRQVVNSEIGPLLDEYWFDNLDKSKKARKRLLKNF